jgi:putative transposase
MRERLKELFLGLCQKWECELKECNGEEDHMHLLVSLTPKVTPSVFVNNLKTVSARMLRKEYEVELKSFYKERVLWSRTYCMVTCGGAPLSVLKRYIENQGVLS